MSHAYWVDTLLIQTIYLNFSILTIADFSAGVDLSTYDNYRAYLVTYDF